MKKSIIRAALCLIISVMLAVPFFLMSATAADIATRSDGQTNSSSIKKSNTTLLIYADDVQNELIALFLVADSPGDDVLSVLSIPVNSRTVITAESDGAPVTLNAPIRKAYSQGSENRLDCVKEGVEMLLGGAVIDRVIALSPENLGDIVDAYGGMRVNSADLPPIDLIESTGESLTYPADSDTDNLALWLKRQTMIRGKNADYDIDIASITVGMSPPTLTSPDFTTVLLSGKQTRAMLDFTIFQGHSGTDILQIRRLQTAFLWLLHTIDDGSESTSLDTAAFLRYDSGDSILRRIAGYERQRIDSCMAFPSGVDRTFAGESHWIFDNVWLHDWLMQYVYLK